MCIEWTVGWGQILGGEMMVFWLRVVSAEMKITEQITTSEWILKLKLIGFDKNYICEKEKYKNNS